MNEDIKGRHRYTACGLDNVFLVGLPRAEDRAGDETITIPNINELHALLRRAVAEKTGGLDPKEVRFLRTELGCTQAELAQVLHKDAQTVGRWERGETLIDGNSETLLRTMALEGDEGAVRVRDLASRSIPTAAGHAYHVDASDPCHYQMAA